MIGPVQPAVGVVIATRDRQPVLAECVRAVRRQTVPVEIVVADDGSTDGTAGWLADQPDVVLVRHDRSRGGPAARNAGAAATTAPWLAFCDDDDLWSPDKLGRQLAALADHPSARWSATGAVRVDARRRIVGAATMPDPHETRDELEALLRKGNAVPGGGSTVVVARDLFDDAGGFALDMPGSEDWELWLRLAARSPLAYVDQPLAAYRTWTGNRSRDVERSARANAEIRRRHGIAETTDDQRFWPVHVARVAAEAGDRWGAAAAYARAGLRHPPQLAYAAASLVSPELVARRLRDRDRAAVPPAWAEQARQWLATV